MNYPLEFSFVIAINMSILLFLLNVYLFLTACLSLDLLMKNLNLSFV